MEPRPRTDELAAGSDKDTGGSPGRRRLWLAVALVAGLVALAVVRPDLALHAQNPAQPRPTAEPTGDTDRGGGLSTVAWDTRGDLASDYGFVSSAIIRIRQDRPQVARVFFAGRLPDGSRLVLAGSDDEDTVATAVHALVVGPGEEVADAPITELTALSDPQQVLAWAGRDRRGQVSAVLLSRPGPVRFEVSPQVTYADDGAAGRIWTPRYAEDGLVVTDLGSEADPVVTVRATGPGVTPAAQVVRVVSATGRAGQRPLRIAGVNAPTYRGPDPDRLVRALQQQAGAVADLGASNLRVLWSGALWKQRRLALVLITRWDGVRLQALVGQQGNTEFPFGVRALPYGGPALLPWLLEPVSPEEPTLLLCPTGEGTVVYSRRGQPDRTLPVPASGVAGLLEPGSNPPSTSGARVTLLDPKGQELLSTVLPETGFDDALALD